MIQLKHTIDPAAGTLTLHAAEDAKADIAELLEEGGGRQKIEAEALEYLIGNSELQSLKQANTGELTDAPLLGILNQRGGFSQRNPDNSQVENRWEPARIGTSFAARSGREEPVVWKTNYSMEFAEKAYSSPRPSATGADARNSKLKTLA